MAATAIGYALLSSGTGSALDRLIAPLRFAAVAKHASGKVAIVEMDAASAAAIDRWPWSRENYARVVDRLRSAGASSIVFDVDFSSPFDASGDAAFATALARADGLVALPTFSQRAGNDDARSLDALPIPALRPHVALASVSIQPDPDGQVRRMPFGTVTAATPRPSLSAYIAARSGTVGTDYPIDMSIDPRTIPRLSFVAVRDGRFDPARVRGKDVLIGATAIEMGDRYGTPHWGVIPGVVVQALASETLLRGVPAEGSPYVPFALAAVLAWLMATRPTEAGAAAAACIGLVGLVSGALIAQHMWLVTYPLATSLAMIGVAAAGCGARTILRRFRRKSLADEPTGLPNKRALLTSGETRAIAILQIDNFDNLHAVVGAAANDLVVRLADRVRLAASGVVYRLADRQLAFALDPDEVASDTLDGLRAILQQPVDVAGRRVDVAASIGVTRGTGPITERRIADAALAADDARRSGRFWSDAATDQGGLERAISLMGELDEALNRGHIEVHYQPKYDLRRDAIYGAEALVRWRHTSRGFIGPDLFIPLAEQSNRIGRLTLFVVERVMRDVLAWQPEMPGLTAAINISAKLLSDETFNGAVEQLLGTVGVPATALIFEVTESAAMSDPDAALAALRRYRELGIAVSMDDYGTGQSTLTYLRRLPLNELKIDRSFVEHAHRDPRDALLVKSTVELAHGMGLTVVAEGVEDADCFAFLKANGCDTVQGYFIGRPVPLARFLDLVRGPWRAGQSERPNPPRASTDRISAATPLVQPKPI